MTRAQVVIWFLCLVMGLFIVVILNQPEFYALLAFILLGYPVFCDAINWISQKIKNYLGDSNDIQTD